MAWTTPAPKHQSAAASTSSNKQRGKRFKPDPMPLRTLRDMKTFKLPSTISFVQDNRLIYGEYLAKMENCIWTIGYTRRDSTDFAICVVDGDYETAKEQLKNELIRLGQFN
jgi:hypothetical protein